MISNDQCIARSAALASGELSIQQAHEITRTERERPGSERELLDVARNSGLRTLKEHARKRRHQAIGVDKVHRRQIAARCFRHWTNDLGNIAFSGELPPETGVPFVNRLEAESVRVRSKAKKRGGVLEGRAAYAAEALVSMMSGGRRPRAPSSSSWSTTAPCCVAAPRTPSDATSSAAATFPSTSPSGCPRTRW